MVFTPSTPLAASTAYIATVSGAQEPNGVTMEVPATWEFITGSGPATVNAETPLEKALQGAEAAAAELRGDASWSQALVDGPRVLGVQAYDHFASTLRLQVRTVPTRQEEVCRELRRRIQMEFQRQGISPASRR